MANLLHIQWCVKDDMRTNVYVRHKRMCQALVVRFQNSIQTLVAWIP